MSWEYPAGATAQLGRAQPGAPCSFEYCDAPADAHCAGCGRHLCAHHQSFSNRGNCGPCEWKQLDEDDA